MTLDLASASILLGFLVLYTKVIFDYSRIKAELQQNATILVKIETLLSAYDERIELIDRRLIVIETQHHEHHRKSDKE